MWTTQIAVVQHFQHVCSLPACQRRLNAVGSRGIVKFTFYLSSTTDFIHKFGNLEFCRVLPFYDGRGIWPLRFKKRAGSSFEFILI